VLEDERAGKDLSKSLPPSTPGQISATMQRFLAGRHDCVGRQISCYPGSAVAYQFAMIRLSLAIFVALLGFGLSGFASVNFSGTWVLDLKASDSPEPMMKRLGASALERKLAASTKLESTYIQSGNLLTITTKGPGFSRTEHLRLDGHPETKTEKRTGTYTIRTSWAQHGKELISTSSFRTKAGKNAELIVVRKLTDAGNTLVLSQTLKIEGEPPEPALHRIWRRRV